MAKKPSNSKQKVARKSQGKTGPARQYVLGLMAGTSADGVDAACVRIEGVGESMRVRLVEHFHRPFSPSLRRRLLAVMAPAETTTEELARLHADLGDAFAAAAKQAIGSLKSQHRPSLIGLAGQTVCNLPGPQGRTVTLQLGDPARVAARTGLETVGEFRQGDVAAGGQGAPLVPWTDWVLFRDKKVSRAIQNIGGIGNVTWLPAPGRSSDVVAFDTGPGNMVIDGIIGRVTGGRQRMDRDGRRAARGRVLPEVLTQWLKHPFFKRKPPRSTGREEFGRVFVEAEWPRLKAASRNTDDYIATATAFTARSIARAYRRFLPGFQDQASQASTQVILCGGGAYNLALMSMLSAELPGIDIRPIDAVGMPAQAKEAVSFAMLAAARMQVVPANLPQVTGATGPAILGAVVRY